MQNFCNTLIEEHEEDLKERIMKGDMFEGKNLDVRLKRWLCYRASSLCDVTQLTESSGKGEPLPAEFLSLMGESTPAMPSKKSPSTAEESGFFVTLKRTKNLFTAVRAHPYVLAWIPIYFALVIWYKAWKSGASDAAPTDYSEEIRQARIRQEEELCNHANLKEKSN